MSLVKSFREVILYVPTSSVLLFMKSTGVVSMGDFMWRGNLGRRLSDCDPILLYQIKAFSPHSVFRVCTSLSLYHDVAIQSRLSRLWHTTFMPRGRLPS